MQRKIRRRRGNARIAGGLLSGVIPLAAGGCPDVRNGVVDAFETATVYALTDRSAPDTATTFQNDLMRTLVALFYDELRIQRVQ